MGRIIRNEQFRSPTEILEAHQKEEVNEKDWISIMMVSTNQSEENNYRKKELQLWKFMIIICILLQSICLFDVFVSGTNIWMPCQGLIVGIFGLTYFIIWIQLYVSMRKHYPQELDRTKASLI